MVEEKLDPLFEPYILNILRMLNKPKRFGELTAEIKNRRTLSLKLTKLRKHRLIQNVVMVANGKYTNGYQITSKGKKVLTMMEKL